MDMTGSPMEVHRERLPHVERSAYVQCPWSQCVLSYHAIGISERLKTYEINQLFIGLFVYNTYLSKNMQLKTSILSLFGAPEKGELSNSSKVSVVGFFFG